MIRCHVSDEEMEQKRVSKDIERQLFPYNNADLNIVLFGECCQFFLSAPDRERLRYMCCFFSNFHYT